MDETLRTPQRSRASGSIRRVVDWGLQHPAFLTLIGLTAGFLAAQAGLPARVTEVQAQIAQLQRADSIQVIGQNRFAALLTEVSKKLDAGHRLQCIEARERALTGDRGLQLQLDAAEISCGELLGNRIHP